MPSTREVALRFLSTRWSDLNENKIKGIQAEIAFKRYLREERVHYIPGGWIMTPGKKTHSVVPTKEKICLLPRLAPLPWHRPASTTVSLAEIAAYSAFRQVGMKAYFVMPTAVTPASFQLPQKARGSVPASYPTTYGLQFNEIGPNGLRPVSMGHVFAKFPRRNGRLGMRCHPPTRREISVSSAPWNDADAIAELFWFEYARYVVQIQYQVANNDLDMFVIGRSGSSYPVEIKSKEPAEDEVLGKWFGIDIGPYAKLAFFTANAMNNDALYVVQEVNHARSHVAWHGIKFTELVKCCTWVGQAGGQGGWGGTSATLRIPKAAFSPLGRLLRRL